MQYILIKETMKQKRTAMKHAVNSMQGLTLGKLCDSPNTIYLSCNVHLNMIASLK